MATISRPPTASRPRDDRAVKKTRAARQEIWSSLLRQTREAQARSHSTSAIQHRSLLLCGGKPEDQRAFVQSLARPPPPAPPSRNRDVQKPRGVVKLSNRVAYGYGYVTLFTPAQQGAGLGGGLLGGKAEEAVRLEVHTVPEAEEGYERVVRRVLEGRKEKEGETAEDDGFAGGDAKVEESRRPAACLLLSWKEPWRFLALLRAWLRLLAKALLPPGARAEDPMEVVREHKLAITVVVQHVEAQEGLERENYREETFDYISQCIRTCILPLSAALVFTSSSSPPQRPGSALSETQKVLYTSLRLDLAPLSPAPPKGSTAPARREDLAPKHNVVDRMAIVVPSGWDSAGKIRLLSETFTPESVLEAWTADLNVPLQRPVPHTQPTTQAAEPEEEQHTNGGAPRHDDEEQEVYATSPTLPEDPDLASRALSPSAQTGSAISTYEAAILDPNAHKAAKPPVIEVTTQPPQQFLAEMRAHLQQLEAEDAKAAAKQQSSGSAGDRGGAGGRVSSTIGLPSGEQTGALGELGDVSFNVGGVSYNTVSAEAAIERLRRPTVPESPAGAGVTSPGPGVAASLASSSPRTSTPRPPRREDREVSGGAGTPVPKTEELSVEGLQEYFSSLVKKTGGGSGSRNTTPSKGPGK